MPKKVYKHCNASLNGDKDLDKIKKTIREVLGVFGVSFQDTIANKYTNLISEIKQASTIFYPDYKGLFRFSKACTTLMRNVFLNFKALLLNEDLLTQIILNVLQNKSEPWDSFDSFQKDILDNFISLVEIGRITHSQKDVDCLSELVNIVYSCYIELSSKEWHKLARENQKITMQSFATVTDDLREAEKGLRTVMSHDASMQYASLVQTIEIKNS